MPHGRAALAAIALSVVLIGGCSHGNKTSAGLGTAASANEGAVRADERACSEPGPAVPLPADAEPTAVLRCTVVNEVAGGDESSVTVHQRATGLAMLELVAALRLPSEPRGTGACTTDLRLPTVVSLETGSGPIEVAPPKDSCGKTRVEVMDAYDTLDWIDVSRAREEPMR